MEKDFYPLQQPEEITIREKEDAMGSYFMMFASLAAGLPLPIINLIAAIIYYSINKHKSRFVKFHSLQSLLSQVPVSIFNAVLVVWSAGLIFSNDEISSTFIYFISFVVFLNVIYIIFSILAAVKARKGEMFYFYLIGNITYNSVYRVDENIDRQFKNMPPV